MQIVLNNGFECEVTAENLNDWDLLENLRKVDKGDISPLPDVALSLIGKDQTEALKNYLRTENGRVPMDGMINAITEILNKCDVGKKS